jgi:predicted DsbA family dithiol-disulfide isomerase
MPPEYRARIEQGRPRLHHIARENYGVEMNPGPFGIDSRPALIGAKYAEANGHGSAYHDRIMRAYWDEAKDIGNQAVLAALAEEVGIDREEFSAALENPTYVREVDDDIRLARRYGLNGVPALVFEDRYLISGAQTPDVLRRVVDQIRTETGI